MTIPVELLEAQVLSLPRDQRSRLLDRLLASLDVEPGWEEEWAVEVDRREAAIAAGQAGWRPVDEVIARLQATLE